jgi:hypothetical protein
LPAAADALRQFKAVHFRHVHVEDGNIERSSDLIHSRAVMGDSVSRGAHAPFGGLQVEDVAVGGVIIHDEHAFVLQFRLNADEYRVFGRGAGLQPSALMVKKKVEPLPGPSLLPTCCRPSSPRDVC